MVVIVTPLVSRRTPRLPGFTSPNTGESPRGRKGIPPKIPLIHHEIIDAGSVSCGFPEGDVWSVLVMIMVATAWVVSVLKWCVSNRPPALSAYADNWSWILQDVNLHLDALRTTLWVTRICGLTIDFQKTWYWCTCNHDAIRITDLLQPLLPPRLFIGKRMPLTWGFKCSTLAIPDLVSFAIGLMRGLLDLKG